MNISRDQMKKLVTLFSQNIDNSTRLQFTGGEKAKCHTAASFLVALFNDSRNYVKQADGFEGTLFGALRNNAYNESVFLCSCKETGNNYSSHSFIILKWKGFIMHLEANAPHYSLEDWIKGTAEAEENSPQKSLMGGKWLSVENYIDTVNNKMDDVLGFSERGTLSWFNYKVNREKLVDMIAKPAEQMRVLGAGPTHALSKDINKKFGSG